jgi:hypothetical protein
LSNAGFRLALLGAAIRIALAPFFMHTWDIATILTATDQFLKGISPYQYVVQQARSLYETTGLPLPYYGFAYLPVVLYIYAPFYALYQLLPGGSTTPLVGGHSNIQTGLTLVYPQLYAALFSVKLPVIIADTATIYLLHSRSPKAAKIYALSPYVMVVTSIWGNFDPLVGHLLLLSYLTFKDNKFVSGLLFGLSTMKFYTMVCLGAFLPRLINQPKQLMRFLTGFAIAHLPTLYYLVTDTENLLHIVAFQGTRPINGVNIYYSMVAVRGLEQVLSLTRIISAIFVIAVILVSVSYARNRVELNEAITGLMLTYVVFAPVTNEQLLAALVPIGLISRNFSHKLTIFPLLYIAFNSTYHYFAIPIFFSSQELRTVWESFNALWGLMVKDYQLQLRYLFGVGLGLSAFWLLSDTKHIPKTVLRLGVSIPFKKYLS